MSILLGANLTNSSFAGFFFVAGIHLGCNLCFGMQCGLGKYSTATAATAETTSTPVRRVQAKVLLFLAVNDQCVWNAYKTDEKI